MRSAARIHTLLAHIQTNARNNLARSTIRSMSTAAPAADERKHWAVFYNYVPDVMEKRAPFRPAHLALAQQWKASGKMLQGGAMLAEAPLGALLTFFASRAEVEEFVKSDPYVAGGIVTDYQIREWTVVIGAANNPNLGPTVAVGDRLPSGLALFDGTPANSVSVDELTKGKKVLFFGVPGAFTPGCSKTHLPGYVADAEKLKSKGIDEIVCVSVNDPFVHSAWGDSAGAGGKVRMLADTTGDFTRRLGLALDLSAKLGSVRSARYSMLVEDGVVKQINLEPKDAPTGLTCSLASAFKL